MKKYLSIIIIIISILTPLLIITSAMRFALSPVFYQFEYALPNFPDDSYGFTKQDRLKWADLSIKYLLGSLSDEGFAKLTFPDGSPLFNQREISHMVDVRDLTVKMLWAWRVLILVFLAAILIAWRNASLPELVFAMGNGARLTIGLILSILIFVWIDFNSLFTLFHRVFFEGDSWLFYLSDTLIRLFPIKFWQDLFIFIGGFCSLGSIMIIFLSRKMRHN